MQQSKKHNVKSSIFLYRPLLLAWQLICCLVLDHPLRCHLVFCPFCCLVLCMPCCLMLCMLYCLPLCLLCCLVLYMIRCLVLCLIPHLLIALRLPDCVSWLMFLILEPLLLRRLVLYLVQLQLILPFQLSKHLNKLCQMSFFICSQVSVCYRRKANISGLLIRRLYSFLT